jgi:hypothetical protein
MTPYALRGHQGDGQSKKERKKEKRKSHLSLFVSL